MKKRQILFLATALLLFVSIIVPALVNRISFEENHKGYVTALDLNDTAALFPKNDFYRSLYAYKAAGITTAVLRENDDGDFNEDLILMAKLAGLDVAIAVYGGNEKPSFYANTLRYLIQTHDVKYLLLKTAEDATETDTPFAQLIEEFNLTLVLCENKTQLSNEAPPELDACIQAADGRLLRAYETYKTPSKQYRSEIYNPDLIYHQMYNSVRDRNTEFLWVQQLTDASENPEENAAVTQAAVQKFCAKIESLGYIRGVDDNLKGYTPNLHLICAAGAVIAVLMLLYILCALFENFSVRLQWALYALALASFALTLFLPIRLVLLYPTLFAPLGACFAFTFCYRTAKKYNGPLRICVCTAIAFATLFVCTAILSAMLSGASYYLNVDIFRGVSLTLLLPVGFAGIVFLLKESGLCFKKQTAASLLAQVKPQIRKRHIILAIIGIVVMAIYLRRSGNAGISVFEYRMRNFIGEIAIARPRTKEFLIAWPCFALFVCALKQNQSRILTLIFGVGSAILFASVLNTFCHVFTDYAFSLLRTVNGLLFSIPFTAIFTIAYKFCAKHLAFLDTHKEI